MIKIITKYKIQVLKCSLRGHLFSRGARKKLKIILTTFDFYRFTSVYVILSSMYSKCKPYRKPEQKDKVVLPSYNTAA